MRLVVERGVVCGRVKCNRWVKFGRCGEVRGVVKCNKWVKVGRCQLSQLIKPPLVFLTIT